MPWIIKLKNKDRYYLQKDLRWKSIYGNNLQNAFVFSDQNKPLIRRLNSSQELIEIEIKLKDKTGEIL